MIKLRYVIVAIDGKEERRLQIKQDSLSPWEFVPTFFMNDKGVVRLSVEDTLSTLEVRLRAVSGNTHEERIKLGGDIEL